jgi:hypothetical protein
MQGGVNLINLAAQGVEGVVGASHIMYLQLFSDQTSHMGRGD